MRQHQFLKVEMVQVCAPEDSSSEHEAMTAHAESLLQLLGLPHRKMRLCSGDVGFSASLCYDLEVSVREDGVGDNGIDEDDGEDDFKFVGCSFVFCLLLLLLLSL